MNERDPFDAVPSNDIERMLDDAFRSRPMPPVARPSITDVHRRARRRQQRRSGAMLGALAVMGVGGAVALASRGDGHDRTALRPGDDAGVASTVACYSFATTTFPPTTMAFLDSTTAPAGSGTYTINAGDIPSVVAQKFGITLEALNAANANTTGYEAFYVGLTIVIPVEAFGTTPTVMFPPGDPCGTGGSYHCTGPLGTDDAGAQVFAQCTFFPAFIASTTTSTFGDLQSGSTYPGEFVPVLTASTTTSVECPPSASCAIPGYTGQTTTAIISPTTSSIEPASTTPAVDPNVATTTTTTVP